MQIISEFSAAVQSNDPDGVRAATLKLLAEDMASQANQDPTAADAEALPLTDVIDLCFDMGDWLFEHGHPEAAAEIYSATFEKLRKAGPHSRLELARRLDRLAKGLIAAQRFEAAAKALEGSLELSQSAKDLDGQAVLWRLQSLANVRKLLGDTDGEAVARAEFEKLKLRSGLGELGSAPWIPEAQRPQATISGYRPKASFDGLDDDIAAVPPEDQYRSLADQIAEVPDSSSYYKVPVHFATHRKPNDIPVGTAADPYDCYGHKTSGTLNFGRALVTVPVKRDIGQYEEPTGGLFGNGGSLEKSFTIQSVDIVGDQKLFVSGVDRDLSTSENLGRRKELLVFLHGYRTTLASGLMRAAQLKVDMKIEGSVVLYSLPSRGTWWAYGGDRDAAADPIAAEHVRDLLLALSKDTGAERIHLVAHSLGSEMLMRALNELWKMEQPNPPKPFGEVIFAAPDVDHQDFVSIVPRITELSERVTVYASQRDLPLMLVSWLVEKSRAGFDPAKLAGLPNVDSIETTSSWRSSFWGNWGHWDFTEHAVDDVRAVVWLSLLPEGRARLIKPRQSDDGKHYWAVEIGSGFEFLRIALEWARRLELDVAIQTISNAIDAEKAMQPPGARLAEFQGIESELQNFLQNVRGSHPRPRSS